MCGHGWWKKNKKYEKLIKMENKRSNIGPLISTGGIRHPRLLIWHLIKHLILSIIEGIGGANEHIVWNIAKVPTETKPFIIYIITVRFNLTLLLWLISIYHGYKHLPKESHLYLIYQMCLSKKKELVTFSEYKYTKFSYYYKIFCVNFFAYFRNSNY